MLLHKVNKAVDPLFPEKLLVENISRNFACIITPIHISRKSLAIFLVFGGVTFLQRLQSLKRPCRQQYKGGVCPLTPHAQQHATHHGAPFGRTPMAQQGEPPAPPSSVVKSYSGKVIYTSKV